MYVITAKFLVTWIVPTRLIRQILGQTQFALSTLSGKQHALGFTILELPPAPESLQLNIGATHEVSVYEGHARCVRIVHEVFHVTPL
jgi:hypothetical protein